MNWLAIAIYLADSDERPVLVVDDTARVRLFNVACERLLGWRREDVVDRPLDDLVDDGSRSFVRAAIGTAIHGLSGRCAVKMPTADGTLVDADLVLQPVPHGAERERAIVGVVESASSGDRWLEVMAPRLARERLSSLARRHGLSEREREVLDLLVRGQTVEDIGRALGIAPRTAKFHQANVLDKLGVGSRVELIRLLVTEE